MALADLLLPELDQEMATTRRCLERLPDDKWSFKPHEKSMDLGGLASHVANLLTWAAPTFEGDAFDMHPPGGEPVRSPRHANRDAVLAAFDRNVAEARRHIAAANDEAMAGTWSLKMQDQVLFSMPRSVVVRSFILSHAVHHRGQLSVYLRLLDVPVPAIYGPSADER